MDIEQLEAFALAEDRTEALKQLIPGSEDYYFFHALDHEHAGRLDRVKELLAAWIKGHGRTHRVMEIERRLALASSDFTHIKQSLGLRFDHAREVEGRVTDHPESLDQDDLAWDTLAAEAMRRYSNLDGFTEHGLESLDAIPADRRGHFLDRLTRPDHPQLVALIAADLNEKGRTFGSRSIHPLLTLKQLDELAREHPKLIGETAYVNVVLRRLQPSPDVDWTHDSTEHEAYLERLWAFVEPLSQAFNALKVNVLFHRLSFDRKRGDYSRQRFLRYLELPRSTVYAKKEQVDQHRNHLANLGQDFSGETLLPPVRDDVELVSDYLAQFLRDDETPNAFVPWIRDDFLKRIFATTKILAGVGDQERWYTLLGDPAGYQALKERVDIDLAPINRIHFAANDPVVITVDVKNVPSLVVKVFEINALNYLLANGREVDTSVDLDGLVASIEKSHTYSEPALRRVRRDFTFPELKKPGVYVVELIGNGRSSRALIKKGTLRYLERIGSAGHAFTILDEDNHPLPDATLWLGGREYLPKDGEIMVPFSTQPGRVRMLMRHGALTTADDFLHRAETYRLVGGIYVDRESLLAKKKADIVVRASLDVNGAPANLALLEQVTLVIESRDRHGISSTQEVPSFMLHANKESVHTILVPEDLAHLSVTLRAKARSLSEQRDIELSDSASFALNGIDSGNQVEALHLSQTTAGWVLYLYGKSGEARRHRPISLTLVHRDFTFTVDKQVQSDAHGRVELGALAGIIRIDAQTGDGVSGGWSLAEPTTFRPHTIQARAGDDIMLPWKGGPLDRRSVSLFEQRGGGYLRDAFDALTIDGGVLTIDRLTPGDYVLFLKDEGGRIEIRTTQGEVRGRWLVSKKRLLEVGEPPPVFVRDVAVRDQVIGIQLGNCTPDTRVHVFATRFFPTYSLIEGLGKIRPREPAHAELSFPQSYYLSGRDIGDEYRYILERRSAAKFCGSMLARPGLLLNPWAVRKTAMDRNEARGGGGYAPSPAMSARSSGRGEMDDMLEGGGSEGTSANLDFLPEPTRVLLDLRPDASGLVRVPCAGLEGMSLVRIAVIDGRTTLVHAIAMEEPDHQPQDLRLRVALDANAHFIEKKQASLLEPTQKLVVEDITTSSMERFDTLGRVFRLFVTLSGNSHLNEMSFVTEWPKLDEGEKRAKYSEFACHELSFFLSHKDKPFFTAVIKPYLVHKKDKTFMDRYLLEDDISSYLHPWAYGRLNVLERILLSQRMASERGPTARHVRELFELLPPDPEGDNRLFDTAIKGSALETADGFGFAQAQASAMLAQAADAMPRDKAGAPKKRAKAAAAPASPARREMAKMEMDRERADESEEMSFQSASGPGAPRDTDLDAREESRQHFRKIDKTEEFAENNYYKVRIHAQDATLVQTNAFWRDYAAHDHQQPFLSAHFTRATRNFSEMMCALAVLDLPFAPDDHAVTYAGARMELTAASLAVVLHREIRPVAPSGEKVPVLVSQSYFRQGDEYIYEGGEQIEKYVTDELLVHVVYLCRVVLTNPSSSRQKLDLLLQIPAGSMPVSNGFRTKGLHVQLDAHGTQSIEYAFYFPKPGEFAHFPVHAAKNEALVAFAPPATLKVVETLSTVDQTSWQWVSQNAEPGDVLKYLEANNIARLDLGKLAWRMQDRSFYDKVLAVLVTRHTYSNVLWSYAMKHADPRRTEEFLAHDDGFLRGAGYALVTPLISVDPVERRWYEHMEYAPLVNARAHRLGSKAKILNEAFAQQYRIFLEMLTYKKKPDLLAATYYLLLQDRIADAIALLRRVGPSASTQLQYDYLCACVAFHTGHAAAARSLATTHKDHPVDKWRKLFQNVLAQLDELKGGAMTVIDASDRTQRQTQLAATQTGLELSVAERRVTLQYQNLKSCELNYYLMDIELLFSRQPFVQQQSERFSIVAPNETQIVALSPDKQEHSFDLPEKLQSANIVVEVVAGGIRKAQAYYAHQLGVQVVEPYGQVRVARRATLEPVPKCYVKVYARMNGGQVKFYKDGYTDLRGCFDYATLSTDELDQVERFALMIMSDGLGAVIREAAPPQR